MTTQQGSLYPRAWYPLLASSQLKADRIQPVQAFERAWVVFRDARGQAQVLARYCAHMGADLANGCIEHGTLVCPLHGWRYAAQGRCIDVPSINDPELLPSVSLDALPTQERYGIVFVFLGDRVDYDLPLPPAMPGLIAGGCSQHMLDAEYHVPCLNTFDLQHYRFIHHRELVETPRIDSRHPAHLGISMLARVLPLNRFDRLMRRLMNGPAHVDIDCWGASLLLMHNRATGYGAVIAMLPVSRWRSRLFIVPVTCRDPVSPPTSGLRQRLGLLIAGVLVRRFLRPDTRALSGMRPHADGLLPGLDEAVARYWAWFRALPRYAWLDHED